MREKLLDEYWDRLNELFAEFDGFSRLVKKTSRMPWFFFDRQKKRQHEEIFDAMEKKLALEPETRLSEIFAMFRIWNQLDFYQGVFNEFDSPIRAILECAASCSQNKAQQCFLQLQLAINIIDEQIYKITNNKVKFIQPTVVCKKLIQMLRTIGAKVSPKEVQNQADRCNEKIYQLIDVLQNVYIPMTLSAPIGCGQPSFVRLLEMQTGCVFDPDAIVKAASDFIDGLKILIDGHMPPRQTLNTLKKSQMIPPNRLLTVFANLQKSQNHIIKKNFFPVVDELPTYELRAVRNMRVAAACLPASKGEEFNDVILSVDDKLAEFDLRTLVVHEGDPGHAFSVQYMINSGLHWSQISLPMMTGFGEGWAVYAETLGEYKTNAAKIGLWMSLMWRAARVVIDVGIHCKGWTEEQAGKFLTEHSLLDQERVKLEVVRYISWPGQASTYWLGYKSILKCRNAWPGNVKEFHDRLLGSGVHQLSTIMKNFGVGY
jgi:hypothetical protein